MRDRMDMKISNEITIRMIGTRLSGQDSERQGESNSHDAVSGNQRERRDGYSRRVNAPGW